jgi:radical SAM superfamily enzyme YgiQ (UPF0313 family)
MLMIGQNRQYQAKSTPLVRPDDDERRSRLRSEAIQTVGRATGCCYPEGSLDAVLDWMSDNAESIWREAERPGFGGSGDLRTMVEALRVYATG